VKRFSFFVVLALLLNLVVVGATANEVYSEAGVPARITLSPTSGFSAITITGSGFYGGEITINWDGERIPTVPSPLYSYDTQEGRFTAIISVPTQTDPGEHIVIARDQEGAEAGAVFEVVDMTGPQGLPGGQGSRGEQGPPGEQGSPGEPGPAGGISIAAVVLALIALGLTLLGRIKKWVVG